MGKYNLGKSTSKVLSTVSSEGIYLNEAKSDKIVKNSLKELDNISDSLSKVNIILNKAAGLGILSNSRSNTFKAWAKKSKEQANNALKVREKLDNNYSMDVKNYPIKLLDDRIAELERKIADMSN